MDDLFSQSYDFADDVFRNITSLRKSENLFDDLLDDEDDTEAHRVAILAEMRVKAAIKPGIIQRGFHYNAAIAYPFIRKACVSSRYTDGSFGVWYGCLDMLSTIHETAYHMMQAESGIEGWDEPIYRERAVYKVHCQAILLDLRDKATQHPYLIADEYQQTQQIGSRLKQEGHPGALVPSARCDGDNVTVFNPTVLSQARVHCYLNYTFDPREQTLYVERNVGEKLLVIHQTK